MTSKIRDEAYSNKDDGSEAQISAPHSQIGVTGAATGTVFWTALVVGGILILLGLGILGLQLVDFTTFLLVLCSGLGILFGAFGSMATIRYKGIVVAGVAAWEPRPQPGSDGDDVVFLARIMHQGWRA